MKEQRGGGWKGFLSKLCKCSSHILVRLSWKTYRAGHFVFTRRNNISYWNAHLCSLSSIKGRKLKDRKHLAKKNKSAKTPKSFFVYCLFFFITCSVAVRRLNSGKFSLEELTSIWIFFKNNTKINLRFCPTNNSPIVRNRLSKRKKYLKATTNRTCDSRTPVRWKWDFSPGRTAPKPSEVISVTANVWSAWIWGSHDGKIHQL